MVERVWVLVVFVDMKAFQVRLEEEVPDLALVFDQIAFGGEVVLRADILGHTQVHRCRRVDAEVFRDQIATQREHAIDLGTAFLDRTHHVEHFW